MPKTVGVCIIAKNEESMIARCLESIKEADQIVVCDTGSKDRTVEIAKKYTDEVYLDYIWTDSFCDAQNHAKSKMKTDWILSIDCDEYLDVPFDEVRRTVEMATSDMVRVHMKAEGGQRLEFGFGRLFKNLNNIYWLQDAHKHLNIPGEGEQVGNVRIIFGYSPAHNLDPDRTLRILEKVVAGEGDSAGRNLYYLGREYWYKRKYPECTTTLGRYVQISNWPAEKAEAFLIMSQCYSAQGMDSDARDACAQAILINSDFKEAIQWMADISTPENATQWKRMARTANNRDILWDRVPAKPVHDVMLISPHCDDESLFASYILMREKPLVVIVTDSYIQYNRGDYGCSMEIRKNETISAMKLVGCPVVFLGIADTMLFEDELRERLKYFNPERVYAPAVHENGNDHHNLIGRVCLELFEHKNIERYCSYSKTNLQVKGNWEIRPTKSEIELKNKMLDCYQSQLNLPSTKPHFDAVRGRSEWLI